MKTDKVIEMLKNEMECVKRAETCDRNCFNCDLLKDADEILEAYEITISILKNLE